MKRTIAVFIITIMMLSLAACTQGGHDVTSDILPNTDSVNSDNGLIISYDNNIYFQKANPDGNGWLLYRRSEIDKENIIVTELPEVGWLHLAGYTLYVATHEKGIYSIDLESGNVTKISDAGGNYFAFTPDWIYGQKELYNTDYGWTGEIYRVRYDGSEYTTLSNDGGACLQLDNESIYYFSYADNAIVKIKLDGSDKEILVDNLRKDAGENFKNVPPLENFAAKYSMVMSNGWIYYIDDYQVYKIKTDGQSNTNLNVTAIGLAVKGSELILLDYSEEKSIWDTSSISVVNINGENKRMVFESGGWFPLVSGDYVYFNSSSSLYRFSTDGSDFEKIY